MSNEQFAPELLIAKNASENPQVLRTKKQILSAARSLMINKGVRSINIDAVSLTSGCSRTTIYRYWRSVDELLFSAFSSLLGEPFEAPETGDFRQDLLVIHQQYVESMKEGAIWIKILPSFIEISQYDDACAKLLEELVSSMRKSSMAVLVRAQKNGHLSRSANLEWIIDLISGSLTYRALLTNAQLDEGGYLEYLIDAATRSVHQKKL